jgi:hypothetical protein
MACAHTSGSLLLADGEPVKHVSEQMGHASHCSQCRSTSTSCGPPAPRPHDNSTNTSPSTIAATNPATARLKELRGSQWEYPEASLMEAKAMVADDNPTEHVNSVTEPLASPPERVQMKGLLGSLYEAQVDGGRGILSALVGSGTSAKAPAPFCSLFGGSALGLIVGALVALDARSWSPLWWFWFYGLLSSLVLTAIDKLIESTGGHPRG